ncbi:MAG: hypothetical protein WC760_12520 [Bacteroidia bacterium]|jgi:hypothetical protein
MPDRSPHTDILIEKLDAFIRKYYKNQVIRGLMYAVILILMVYLLAVSLEYFGHFGTLPRAILLYVVIANTLYLLVRFVFIPLTRLLRIGKLLSYTEASKLIGRHFPDVGDKLLNTLQLRREADGRHSELLLAAIEQKTVELKPVPFSAAIDLRKNARFARYMLIPAALYLIVYLIAPGMISDGSRRVWQYNQHFKEPPPFQFRFLNPELVTDQYSDFSIELEVNGKSLPNEVYILREGNRFKMQKSAQNQFTYTFHSLRQSIPFELEAAGFISETYTLEVLARPHLDQIIVEAHYPNYLGLKAESWDNPGDITVPAGTVLKWQIRTRSADSLWLSFNNKAFAATQARLNAWHYQKKMFVPAVYSIRAVKGNIAQNDSMRYQIAVVPDAYPSLTIEEQTDSLIPAQRYFMGDAEDDHGLTRLTFNYRYTTSEQEEKIKSGLHRLPVSMDAVSRTARFSYQINLSEIGISPSDQVEYYFEVWDNDGVFGAKSTRSKVMVYKAPSVNELEKNHESGSESLKQQMEEAIREARNLQKELKAIENKMHENREFTWEEKKKLEKILQRQQELNRDIEQIKNKQKELTRQEQEFRKQQDALMEKQEQINKLFNEVMSDEMKKLMQQLEEMMQRQNKDAVKDEMEKLQMNNKDVEKELDRMLEQFKQLELEKKREEAIRQLDELTQKQEDLAKKCSGKDKPAGAEKEEGKKGLREIQLEQEKLSGEFKDLKEELKDIQEKNKELEEPKELGNTEKEQQEIEQDQKQSEEQLEKEDPKNAAESQKKAAKKMKELNDKLKKELDAEEQKEDEINAEALREILENTIQLSTDQEQLMEEFKRVNNYNPQYVDMARRQKNIKDNARIIEDSLVALSKRIPEISTFINREVSKLNANLDKSIEGYGSRNIGQIRLNQQQAMMNANNLGVLLSEVLKQLQEQMQAKSSGEKGKQQKKGQGKGKGKGKSKSMSTMKKMQEELNKQLREGLNKQEGKGNKPGEKPGMGSQEYARMAAQQMAIRQQMQKMLNELGAKEKEQLGGNAKLQELQRLMEQTEKELFNKNLTRQMLQRQEEIMTRLLESEKAERKQEEDKKRESEQAKEKPRAAPPSFEQYQKQKQKEQELLQTIPAEMQPYYKEKAKEYFGKRKGE